MAFRKAHGFFLGWGGALRLGPLKGALLGERKGRGRIAEGSWCWKPSPSRRIFPKRSKVRGQGEEKGWRAPQPIRRPTRTSWPWPAVSGRSGRAAVFAERVDTLGLVIRRMVRLVVRRSVPRPSRHTSCRSGVGSGPFWAQTALKRGHLGCCRGG